MGTPCGGHTHGAGPRAPLSREGAADGVQPAGAGPARALVRTWSVAWRRGRRAGSGLGLGCHAPCPGDRGWSSLAGPGLRVSPVAASRPRLRPPPGPPPREARATRRGSVPGAVRVATSVSAMSPCGSVPCGGVRAAPPTSSRYSANHTAQHSANVSRIDFCRKVRSSVTETRGPHFGGCPGSLRQRPGDAHRAGAPCVPPAPRPSPASQGLGATSPAASSRFGCPAGPAHCC